MCVCSKIFTHETNVRDSDFLTKVLLKRRVDLKKKQRRAK